MVTEGIGITEDARSRRRVSLSPLVVGVETRREVARSDAERTGGERREASRPKTAKEEG